MLDADTPEAVEHFAQTAPCVLVSIESAKGSTPRVQGTQMLVSATGFLGTIGGGQLEYMAVDAARALLASDQHEQTLNIPLGPEIGQCCGGHVTLLMTRVTTETLATLTSTLGDQKSRQPYVYLFGAGHVGRALAKALLPLPVNALLIDSRAEELALADPSIDQDLTPLPESHIRAAKPASAFIMMTHDHAQDFLLTREALGRGDAAYIGMIGSQTKRATFARWLESETGSREGMDSLTMPIGASSLGDKRPAVIAAMVVPEILEAVSTHSSALVNA